MIMNMILYTIIVVLLTLMIFTGTLLWVIWLITDSEEPRDFREKRSWWYYLSSWMLFAIWPFIGLMLLVAILLVRSEERSEEDV